MDTRIISVKTIIVLLSLLQCCVFAAIDVDMLYQKARGLEDRKEFAGAVEVYNYIITEFPNHPLAKYDKSGFRRQYAKCGLLLQRGEIVAAREIGDSVRALPLSDNQRPQQLFAMGDIFKDKKYYDDSLRFYNQIISQYPDSIYAGADYSGIQANESMLSKALDKNNIDAMRKFSKQILDLDLSDAKRAQKFYSIGCALELKAMLLMKGQNDLADNVYDIAELFYLDIAGQNKLVSDEYFMRSVIKLDIIDVLRYINRKDMATAKYLVSQVKLQYPDKKMLAVELFSVANGFFMAGDVWHEEECYSESMQLLQSDIMPYYDTKQQASRLYMLGQNYTKLQDTMNAAQCFQQAYKANPNHVYADWLLYAVGRCYMDLVDLGMVDQVEGDNITREYFQRLADRFPASEYWFDAQSWLIYGYFLPSERRSRSQASRTKSETRETRTPKTDND